MTRLPGPRGINAISTVFKARAHYAETYRNLHKTYGDMVRFNIPYPTILLFHPNHIRYVLKDHASNYHKSAMYEVLDPILGKGLVTSEGELWKKQRRIVAPEFHMKSIQSFVEDMSYRASAMADSWEARSTHSLSESYFDISADMMELTFKIVGDTLFGSDLSAEASQVKQALYTSLHLSSKRVFSYIKFPLSWPTPSNRKYMKAASQLQKIVRKIVQKRLETPTDTPHSQDVLSRLLASRQQNENDPISDQQLIDEINTLILAGHETTSQALSWTWYLLSQHPEVENKFHKELQTVLGGRALQFGDIRKLTYTQMILKESMRLYPPIPVISRTPIQEDEINGAKIPVGMNVALCPYVTHRDPRFWPNPEKFDPERFNPENENKILECAYFPFSYGPRSCIGEHFAMVEALVILATLGSRYQLKLKPGTHVKSEASITLRPLGGLPMSIHKIPVHLKSQSFARQTNGIVQTL